MAASYPESTSSISDSNASSASATTGTTPTALPSNEALELLLSPDGYYTYLAIPKPDPSLIPHSRYAANTSNTDPAKPTKGEGKDKPGGGGVGGVGATSEIDLDLVKKNYRRLSLRHHPDRKTGDPETFRVLHRAKVVLSSPKLRREYDLVGLDLDDDAEDHDHHEDETAENDSNDSSNPNESKGGSGEGKSTADSVMSHLASATLAGVLQMVVRTGLMGLVSVVIARYAILTYLAIGLLFFLSLRIYTGIKKALGPAAKLNLEILKDAMPPLLIALGIFCMNRGRKFDDGSGSSSENADGGAGGNVTADGGSGEHVASYSWSWTFWFGEALVMTLFLSNSFEKKSPPMLLGFSLLSFILSLLLRGKFWRYLTLLGFQGIIMLLVVMAFPIMEMILEEIVQEKMRKVGEKIRAHDARVKECLRKQGKYVSSK